MVEEQTDYTHLSRGIRFVLSGPSYLWRGDDHLLVESRSIYSERYRRFYYRDIQAIIIRRTTGQGVWMAVLGIVGALWRMGR